MSGSYRVEELAKLIDGTVYGEGGEVLKGVKTLDEAEKGDLAFFYDLKLLDELLKSKCSAVVVSEEIFTCDEFKEKIIKPIIVVKNVRLSLLNVLELFYKKEEDEHFTGIHPTAIISKDVKLKNVSVGGNVIIEGNVSIGEGTVIYPNCYIGKNVRIGSKCVFFPGVCIYKGCIIGNDVRIHAGTIIGSDGFGYVSFGKTHRKMLQVGVVEIGDDVEIGANVAIDRATVGKTVIGSGTKIDNLVHIAHNVKIGRNCLIAGQVGIAGSSKICDSVMMGGQAGIADHVVIGEGAVIAAQSGVIGSIKPGDVVTGFPARPVKEFMKAHAVLYEWINKKRLPNK